MANDALFLIVAAGGAFLAYSYAKASTGPSAAPSADSGGTSPPPPAPAPAPAPQGGGYPSPDPAPYYPPYYAPPSPNVIFQVPPPSSTSGGVAKPWRISQGERAAIKTAEGLRLTRYPDGAGYSIGYGHHITTGDGIGTTITAARAQQLFDADVASAERSLNSLVRVPLSQNEIDALGDFVFNEGAGAFGRSTMLRLLNAGNFQGAAAQLAQWHYSGGASVPALVTRRAQEAALFSEGLA